MLHRHVKYRRLYRKKVSCETKWKMPKICYEKSFLCSQIVKRGKKQFIKVKSFDLKKGSLMHRV